MSRHQPQQPTFVLSDKLHECNNGNSFYSKLTIRNDSVGATNNSSEHCNEENDNDDNDPVEIEVGDVVVCLSTASSKVSWICVQVLAIYSDHKHQQQNDGESTECKYRHMRIEGRKLYRRAELEGKVDYFPLYEPEQGRSRRTRATTRKATGDEQKQHQQEDEEEEEVFETDELLEDFAVSRILSKPDLLLGNERRGSASKALVLRTRCWYHSTARRFQPIFSGDSKRRHSRKRFIERGLRSSALCRTDEDLCMMLSLHLDVDIDTENLMETSDGRLDAVCDNRGGAGGVKNFKMTARFERMVLANMVCHPDDRPSLPSIHVAIDDFVAVQSDTTNDDDSTSNVTNDTRFYPFTVAWEAYRVVSIRRKRGLGRFVVRGVGCKRLRTTGANAADLDILQRDLDHVGNASPEEIEPNLILGKVADGTDHLDASNSLPLCVFGTEVPLHWTSTILGPIRK